MKNELNYKNPICEKMENRKNWHELKIGVQMMFYNPIKMIPLLVLGLIFIAVVCNIDLLQIPIITGCSVEMYKRVKAIILVTMFFISTLKIISLTGRKYKAKVESMPICEFSSQELKAGHPILTSYRKERKTKVESIYFFSLIDKEIWDTHKEQIARKLCSHCVGDLEYGGKDHNNSHFVVMHIQKGAMPTTGGTLYDEEL